MKGTFYAQKFEGRRTASGERFHHKGYTAAHKYIPFGTYVLVINPKNGKSVIVKINDRCRSGQIIDLTRTAAKAIDLKGTIPVTVQILTSDQRPQIVLDSTSVWYTPVNPQPENRPDTTQTPDSISPFLIPESIIPPFDEVEKEQ